MATRVTRKAKKVLSDQYVPEGEDSVSEDGAQDTQPVPDAENAADKEEIAATPEPDAAPLCASWRWTGAAGAAQVTG